MAPSRINLRPPCYNVTSRNSVPLTMKCLHGWHMAVVLQSMSVLQSRQGFYNFIYMTAAFLHPVQSPLSFSLVFFLVQV